jgi:A118 family predicted phage portal protein
MKLPPDNLKALYAGYLEHDAWYSGSPERLAAVYSNMVVPGGLGHQFFNTGQPKPPRGTTQRSMFWAQEMYNERKTMLHIPIAGDIAQTSANLLFAEPPQSKIAEAHEEKAKDEAKKAQSRLDDIIEKSGFNSKLHEGGETCAALGGVFIKPVWDKSLADYPMVSMDQVDNAIPEFKWGILTAVTFFKAISEDDKDNVYWLLERHEPGLILYGLYKGKEDMLGYRISLQAHPETKHIPDVVNTLLPGILPRYVPNMKPNNRFRGSEFGKSDYVGTEGMMDALDEVWTSWIRDIRLGKGRIIVPEHFLKKDPITGKRVFDGEQEVFTTLEADPLSAAEMGITPSQFEIRTEEHKTTSLELIDRIISTAGYSPQSFGLNIEGSAESGTALNIRERKSMLTRGKKETYWQNAIRDILEMMLFIDKTHLGNRETEVYRPTVEFQDSASNDALSLATAVEMINRASAASIETKVRMLHPDWTEDQIKLEVKLITEQTGMGMPNPEEIIT